MPFKKLNSPHQKISIALCTYNGEKFLPAQLASFAAQTVLPGELIICDDGSRDRTRQIIADFTAHAPFPVKFFDNGKNLGSTKNFEKAIGLCGGDLIFLADQDDVWKLEKIELIIREFERLPDAGMIFSDAELIDDDGEKLPRSLRHFTFPAKLRRKWQAGKTLEVLIHQNVVTGATAAFRANLRDLLLPFPADVPNMIHDGWIALIIAAHSRIYFLEKPLLEYRQHAGQQIGVDWRSKTKTRAEFYEKSIAYTRDELKRLEILQPLIENSSPMAERVVELNKIFGAAEAEKHALIAHYQARQAIPGNWLKRLLPIAAELLTRRYHRFSKGWRSAAKDLFEKFD